MAKRDKNMDGIVVKNILVVGGGSAGWITACLLNACINANPDGDLVKITLVESPNIAKIGVGEATVPSIRRTLQAIGIPESEFMKETDATFKSLIRFIDWNLGQVFDHPFDRRERPGTDADVLAWLAGSKSGENFANTFSILSHTSTNNLAPKAIGWPPYQSTFPYAYHLDANKLATMLARIGVARGIKHILANVADVALSNDKMISHLTLDSGETLKADLYIDCTGFAAKLSGKVAPKCQDYTEHLLCDHAVTVSVPYNVHKPAHILPYTTAKAMTNGWLWDINMQSRRSLGYVYSSQHISKTDAEKELLDAEGKHIQDLQLRHIPFKTYKRAQTWAGNCVAIGLSDGFVEPLESTGLYLMQFSAQALADRLRVDRCFTPATTRQFNRVSQTLFEEILGYITLHYVTSKRADTQFWRDATHVNRLPAHVRDLYVEWRRRPPHDTDLIATHRLFSLESYEYLLMGMEYTSSYQANPPTTNFNLDDAIAKCLAKLPSHEDFLAQL